MPSTILNVVPHDNYLLHYNGFTFDPAVTRTDSIRSMPEWDTANRTIKYMRTTLVITTHIFESPPITTDNSMDVMKQLLESPGGAFYYRDKGFGDFNINIPGGNKSDVAWGPKPGIFSAKPIADSYCWECTWSVEVCIPWCSSATSDSGIVAWNYQWQSEKDYAGYETRRIDGYIEIALTRKAQEDRSVWASADSYREKIQPTCPAFFRPVSNTFILSEDRRTLSFKFSFEQFPGPIPPPGIMKIRLQSSNANDAPSFNAWTWTLVGNYEMVYGFPHALAKWHFIQMRDYLRNEILKETRIGLLVQKNSLVNNGASGGDNRNRNKPGAFGRARRAIGDYIKDEIKDILGIPKDPEAEQRLKNEPTVYPVSFTATNPDMYGKAKCDFTLVHRIAGTAGTLLTCGLWEQVPGGNDWEAWYKSASQAIGPRGLSGSRFNPADDVIIDLCRRPPNISRMTGLRRIEPVSVNLNGDRISIDPRTTWIQLKVDIDEVQRDSILVHKPLLQDRTLRSRQSGNFTSSLKTPAASMHSSAIGVMSKFIPPEDQNKSGFQFGSGESIENVSTIARQAASTYTVILRGEAIRIGIPPTAMNLQSIGGVPAVSANDPSLGDGYRETTCPGPGVPIFVACWQFRYVLPCAPGTNPIDADTGKPVGVPSSENSGRGQQSKFFRNSSREPPKAAPKWTPRGDEWSWEKPLRTITNMLWRIRRY